MSPEVKTAIDKLKIVKNLAQSPETQQVCSIIIELVAALEEKQPLGFGSKDASKKSN